MKNQSIDDKVLFNDLIELYSEPIWIATLSDNSEVYQDDNPDPIIGSAWVRLGNFIRKSNLSIVSIRLRFRSHIELAAEGGDAFYFAKGASGFWGNPNTFHSYVVGTRKNGILTVGRWLVPELVCEDTEIREIEDNDSRLIINPCLKNQQLNDHTNLNMGADM